MIDSIIRNSTSVPHLQMYKITAIPANHWQTFTETAVKIDRELQSGGNVDGCRLQAFGCGAEGDGAGLVGTLHYGRAFAAEEVHLRQME